MRIAWVADDPQYLGGAEMTQAEFLDATPEGVEVVRIKPGETFYEVDRAVVHNVVHYSLDQLEWMRGLPITWFHHDLSPWNQEGVQDFLNQRAEHIFCSPMQREKYGAEGICIPPPVDLDSFKPPRQSKKRRSGTCSIAQWRGPGKGAWQLEEWSDKHGSVDVYGPGEFPPVDGAIEHKGPIDPDKVPQILWQYETFVFLPLEPEPFCRTVAEAHAAGCALVVNNQVGALHYLKNDPEALRTAASDFWEAVCA